jgi:hypothetical protein
VPWHRGGWYTRRWADVPFFPDNQPSADHVVDAFQHLVVGDVVPDGRPEHVAEVDRTVGTGRRAAPPAPRLRHPFVVARALGALPGTVLAVQRRITRSTGFTGEG